MQVIVDDREAHSGVPECLKRMEDTDVIIQRLPVGDYLVDDRLLFERKTMQDFAISLVDGRIFKQAKRLSFSSCRPFYVLEGKMSDIGKLNIRRQAIQGAIISLAMLYGIPLLRSLNAEETARLMSYASIQMHRSVSGSVHRSGYRPKGKRKRQLYILQSLPGIGPVRAEQLLLCFGSLQAVFCASSKELARVSGIGARMARRIHTLVS